MRFRNLLSELSGERIVILSTHIVSDIEAAAAEIVIIYNGRMLGQLTAEQILQAVENKTWTCVIPSSELTVFRQRYLISGAINRSDGLHVRIINPEPPVASAKPVPPNLEDAYLYTITTAQSEPVGQGEDKE